MYIDINCDLGEGIGNEAELLPYVSSCNIACGGHAGDTPTMKRVVLLAKKHQVKIGAHPSYPDIANFGRVFMDLNSKELIETIRSQVAQLVLICNLENIKLHHIKAHGALYNDIAKGGALAKVFLEALEPYKSKVFLYVPAVSVLAQMAIGQGFKIKREAFGDRNYNKDLSLVSREKTNAMILEPQLVLEHLLRMVHDHKVFTVSGTLEEIQVDTYCIHGDTPNALQILMYLSEELPK
jgi:UPF0271 protein